MKITLHGAAGGQVTGSAYHLETDRASLLLDFGIFQGTNQADELNRMPPRLEAAKLDAVLLTHGHLDHTGRLPLLAKHGFNGPMFCTPATIEMANLILKDSAKIQAQDHERLNRKRERAGKPPLDPLFNLSHVEAIMSHAQAVPYHDPVAVAPGITAHFVDSGHMLGSASIQLTVEDQGQRKVVVFSGDLGPKGVPILRDAEPFHEADLVFLESTYGSRDHKPFRETVEEFYSIVEKAVTHKGKILVPTFAVGRAQLLLVLLAAAFRSGRIQPFPIFLDSPMAIEATNIYRHHTELFDDEMVAMMKERPLEKDLAMAKATPTADDSKSINDHPGPCLVMAGAGMCSAGRILHHLRQNLWRPEASVLIVGYQGEGSLGRQLVEGKNLVHIFGEEVAVKASIHTLGGFSAHAGQTDLLSWLEPVARRRPRVALTHGEASARETLAERIAQTYQIKSALPRLGETLTL